MASDARFALYTAQHAASSTSTWAVQALVQQITSVDHPKANHIVCDLLDDLLMAEYKWIVRPVVSAADSGRTGQPESGLLEIVVDPVSVLQHPAWACTPPAKTLGELAVRVSAALKPALRTLRKPHIVARHRTEAPAAPAAPAVENVAQRTTHTKRSRRRRRNGGDTSGPSKHTSKRHSPTPFQPTISATCSPAKGWRPGLCVQHVRERSLQLALEELIASHQPIVRAENVVCTLVEVGTGRYSVRRMDMPETSALWGVPVDHTHTGQPNEAEGGVVAAPFSVSVSTNAIFSDAELRKIVRQLFAESQRLFEMTKSSAIRIPEPLLRLYTLEHVFDRMSFTQQNQLLHYMAVHGVDGPGVTESVPSPQRDLVLLRQAVAHRFIEKGAKTTDCRPREATDVLLRCFPNGAAGRMYMTFARDPAKRHCAIHQYNSVQTKGKRQQSVPYAHHPITRSTVQPFAAAYFSPRPVIQPSPHHLFESTPKVTTASTPPLTAQSPVFAYNQVYNHTFVRGNYLHDPKVCVGQETSNVSLLTDQVQQTLEELRQKGVLKCPLPSTMTLAEYEQHLEGVYDADTFRGTNAHTDIADSNHSPPIHINIAHYVRYIWLRHVGMYARFFYPYVVAKHPNGMPYAEYRNNASSSARGSLER